MNSVDPWDRLFGDGVTAGAETPTYVTNGPPKGAIGYGPGGYRTQEEILEEGSGPNLLSSRGGARRLRRRRATKKQRGGRRASKKPRFQASVRMTIRLRSRSRK